MGITPSIPHLSPLRDAGDPRAEWRLLVERLRQLREELADLETIMDGVLLEMTAKEGEQP